MLDVNFERLQWSDFILLFIYLFIFLQSQSQEQQNIAALTSHLVIF